MSTKIAIIGAGGMAAYHTTGFRQAGAEIVALADVNQAAAEKSAAKYGIGQVFSDVAEMLRKLPELDAVFDHCAQQVSRSARASGTEGRQACILREATGDQRKGDGADASRRRQGEAHADV